MLYYCHSDININFKCYFEILKNSNLEDLLEFTGIKAEFVEQYLKLNK